MGRGVGLLLIRSSKRSPLKLRVRNSQYLWKHKITRDGSHIRILLLGFFYKFFPELIKNGHIYLGMSPLYKITQGKDFIYLLDDAELEEFKEKNKDKKFDVSYFKG